MTDRELMQQALDAMLNFSNDISDEMFESIKVLRARLAQPEPEPVAWWHDRGDVVDLNVSGHGTPLYFAPPQREWQGLTDDEVRDFWSWSMTQDAEHIANTQQHAFARAIEAKLKEKNT